MKKSYLELASDICQLFVNSLDLGLFTLAVPDVRDEDCQATHAIAPHSRHGEYSYNIKLKCL